ncbi:MAG: hypothetical protein AAGK80_09860 [Pseudomonadota bacterium]
MAYLLLLITMIALPFIAALTIAAGIGSFIPFLARARLSSPSRRITYIIGTGLVIVGLAIAMFVIIFLSGATLSSPEFLLVGLTAFGLTMGWVGGAVWFFSQSRKRRPSKPTAHTRISEYWIKRETID